jgi:hypothetical protein
VPRPVPAPIPAPTPVSTFEIDINFSTDPGWTVINAIQEIYKAAAKRWSSVITQDLPDVDMGPFAEKKTEYREGFGRCTYPASIDDLWICVSIGNIGASSILAHATYTKLNITDATVRLPSTGLIAINDQAILRKGLDASWLLPVITHEMGHVASCWAGLFIE